MSILGQGQPHDEISLLNRKNYPSPWSDVAGNFIPNNLTELWDCCELIWLSNGAYSRAMSRVVSYFITDIEVTGDNTTEEIREQYRSFFTKSLEYRRRLQEIGEDRLAYGVSLTSPMFPFTRSLLCEQCQSALRPITSVEYTFRPDKRTFEAYCPKCGKKTKHKHIDNNDESRKVHIKRWSPRDVTLAYNEITGDTRFYLRPPANISRMIKDSIPFALETTPWPLIETILDDKVLQVFDTSICAIMEPTLAGINTGGWGFSQVVQVIRNAYYNQVIRRFNESIALEHIVPTTLLSPAAGITANDPNTPMPFELFQSKLQNILATARRDPGSKHFIPFPVNAQTLGGNVNMAGHELINASTSDMLDAAGVPADFFRGTLQLQAAPVALRLFQQTWSELVADFNNWLQWMADKAAKVWNWDPVEVKLREVTWADDIEFRNIILSLMGSGNVSQRTALSPLHIDPIAENKIMLEEQSAIQEQQAKMQAEQDKLQQARDQLAAGLNPQPMQGAMPGMPGMPGMPAGAPQGGMPGGAPAGGMLTGAGMNMTGSGPMTPMDMLAMAEQQASQLLSMPYEQRVRILRDLDKNNKQLHDFVITKLEALRRQVDKDGAMQARLQLQQGQ